MITIPTKLANLLHGLTDDISASVGSASASVSPILERNEAPFFPDYTDHGGKHIESVLRTCELLVGEASWSVFTREDAAVLILATMAHDLGMLMSVEGFRYLVDGTRKVAPPIETNDEPWHKLWREFQLDTRRFDGATLIKLTGSPEPVALQELDPNHFTERGIRIAGEFLRRHHHRIAHEIVFFGMPAETGMISLFSGVGQHLRDLAGIVARSHGIPLRECLEYLIKRDRTGHREYRHIHPTFLMTLVRLADYLDLDFGRAPASVLAAKSLKSPISRREWWSHKAIVDCHSMTDDPECLHVVVDPSALPDVMTFSVIEAKIIGIQQELDACWAVLGEVYGRFPPLNQLSVKIRRIRSDIRASSTIHKLPFVPYVASLEAARADLLKLLIEPLYGDHPGIGIRELVQNAIDAVRELEYILPTIASEKSVERAELDGDVAVNLEKDDQGKYWVTVADRGIGMNWLTVTKYYLTAGASFRQSDVWKKRFTDDEGASQVLRSGRFGIGVLAAFLLGDRVKISSRHVEEPEDHGVEFEFGLDDISIEMRWVKRKVGTTVKIRTSANVIDVLNKVEYTRNYWPRTLNTWDWYCLDKPLLVRRDINGRTLKQRHKIPGVDDELPDHWHRIQVLGFQAVQWSYRANMPELVCNGILVPAGSIDIENQFSQTRTDYGYRETDLILKDPHVSVFDPDGRLPLSLARDQLGHTPIEIASALAADVSKNFIAYCLTKGPEARLLTNDQFSSYAHIAYPGLIGQDYYFGCFFDSADGFGLSDPWNISHYSSLPGLLIRAMSNNFKMSQSAIDMAMSSYGAIYNVASDGNLTSFDTWIRRLVLHDTTECLSAFKGLKIRGLRILMPSNWHRRFLEKQRRFVIDQTSVQWNKDNWVIWTVGDCPANDNVLRSLAKDFKENRVQIESVTECYFLPVSEHPKPGRIAHLWQDVIGGPVIPFDYEERQRILAKLNKQFEHHVTEWTGSESAKKKRKT